MRKLMWFAIGFAASCVVAVYLLSGSILPWLALAFGVTAIVAMFFKQKTIKITGILLLGFSIGVLWMWGYDFLYLQPARQYDGESVMADIEVTDYSSETDYGATVDGNILLDGKEYRVRVYLEEFEPINPGDRIYGSCTLAMTTPSGEEKSDYYQGKGIFLLASPEGGISIEEADEVPGKYFPAKLRRNITDLLDSIFPEDVLGFVRALLLGDSSLLDYETDTAFKVSGIRHVIAVSGLHVSILFSLVYTVAFRRRLSTAILGIPTLLLFAAVAGFTPSVNRACIMQVLMILALLLNQDYDPPTALAFAVLVLLAVNPMTITSVSFQLSVSCIIGIFMFSGRVSRYILNKFGHPTGNSFKAKIARWISSGAGVTLSAMVFTTPLVAWYFGTVSLISVFTNLLTLWVVSVVFYGIMLSCVLGWMWLPLGKVAAWIVSWFARYVLLVAKHLGSFPLAAVYTSSVYIVIWIAVCYLLFVVFLFAKKKKPMVLLAIMAGCLCLSLAVSYMEPRLDKLRVTVFDVGEGQSILLQSQGKYYLVDCGGTSGEKAADVVTQSLLSQGIMKLDGVILTHYDIDHSGGVSGLLSRIGTEKLYLPDIDDDGSVKEQLIHRYEDKISWVSNGQCLFGEQSLLTMILAPPEADTENENSLCVLFQAENYDILITGDRGVIGEKALLASFELPQLELLVAGHHGASDATNFELLSKTMPAGVVISSGDRYGHPTEEVLQRLKAFGCKVWRTDQDGTIIFRG
ncbi:MAG: DNA internalization-related competence protein ComEC/Rec2 [Oscillospiraceae bacterium]|nr:DNA internalization-related competence protein ComEC/Rec2 [Oscillospiraceae bacterium]